MNKKERVNTVLKGMQPDRVPVGFWSASYIGGGSRTALQAVS